MTTHDESSTSNDTSCFNCRQHPEVPGDGRCRYCILANEALDAFWDVIVQHFPQAKGGDLSPEQTIALHLAASSAICEWISNNVETEDGE
jgi:hypothetical protein